MGVDQAEPLETAGGGAEAVEGGDEDVVVRPDDDIGDLAPAGDQKADLAVDLPGEFRELAGQVVGDDPLRRDAPPVELPDPLDLRRSETGQVAVNLFDGRSFYPLFDLCGLTRFHPVEEGDQAFVRKGRSAFVASPAGRAGGVPSPTFMIRSKQCRSVCIHIRRSA